MGDLRGKRDQRFRSYFLELRGYDQRISLSDLLAPSRFEIERASVNLRVPVGPTESRPAPAHEPGQPDPFPARGAPIRPLLRRLLLLLRRRRNLFLRRVS